MTAIVAIVVVVAVVSFVAILVFEMLRPTAIGRRCIAKLKFRRMRLPVTSHPAEWASVNGTETRSLSVSESVLVPVGITRPGATPSGFKFEHEGIVKDDEFWAANPLRAGARS